MSVIVSGIDVTGYINQGGISETTQKVYSEGYTWGFEENQSKGAHYVYSISARMPTELKDSIADLVVKSSLRCEVDGNSFYGEITDFTASIAIDYGTLTLWNVSFTISDRNLSKEQEAALNAINNI